MKNRMRRGVIIALVMSGVIAGYLRLRETGDDVISVTADNPEMAAAIETARGTLPRFWERFDKPGVGETGFALKVKVTDGDRVEHFWLTNLDRREGKLFGTINNDPEIVANVKLGDHIQVEDKAISDWMFTHDGKIVGNFTLRPLMKQMPAEEAARYKAMLADP